MSVDNNPRLSCDAPKCKKTYVGATNYPTDAESLEGQSLDDEWFVLQWHNKNLHFCSMRCVGSFVRAGAKFEYPSRYWEHLFGDPFEGILEKK